MAFTPIFPRMFPGTFDRHAAAAAAPVVDWWPVTGKTTVAAYQPKGAASQAASYSNLANPGTYDAAPGTAPTWASGTGWSFAASSSHWLTTGYTISAESSTTVLVRFASLGTQVGDNPQTLFSTLVFDIQARWWGSVRHFCGSAAGTSAGEITSGVFALAPSGLYQDGSVRVSFSAGDHASDGVLLIGKHPTQGWYLTANVLAFAVYSDALTAGEVATVSAAMAAL